MGSIRLSILIATTPQHAGYLRKLLEILTPQLTDEVEVLTNIRMDINIGQKRQLMIHDAIGVYVVFIDSDDRVSPKYVELILKALETSPDCVGISGVITTNGVNLKQWHISKDYGYWYERDNCYFRTPNHISPVRRKLALRAGFPEISSGEDAEYSKRLYPLLNTEVKIEGNIYHYNFWQK